VSTPTYTCTCSQKHNNLSDGIGGVKVWLHSFLISALGGREWSTSNPSNFTTGGKNPNIHWIWDWMGLQRWSGCFYRGEKSFAPAINQVPDHPSYCLVTVLTKLYQLCCSEDQLIRYYPAYKTHRPKRRTMIFLLGILEKNYYFNFSNLLEENRIVTYLVTRK
jgi:hypothetical protein